MPVTVRLNPFKPAFLRTEWVMTEMDYECEPEEYNSPCGEERKVYYKQRKWCALLNREQFEQFLCQTGLVATSRTMGSIGAPGFGFGMAPAVSFELEDCGGYDIEDNWDPDVWCNAYVTPCPDFTMVEPGKEDEAREIKDHSDEWKEGAHGWEALEEMMFKLYGNFDTMKATCRKHRQLLKVRRKWNESGWKTRQRRLFT